MTDVSASASGDIPETTDAAESADVSVPQPVDNAGDNGRQPVDEPVGAEAGEAGEAAGPAGRTSSEAAGEAAGEESGTASAEASGAGGDVDAARGDDGVSDDGDDGVSDDGDDGSDAGAPSSTAGRLEEEGDIAADYIEELLDISDIDGDIDIEVRNGRTYLSVIAEDGDERLRDLVGPDGKGLEALQELVRLAVLSATGNRSRLVLDIAGHRSERAGELEVLAQEAVERVRSTGEPVHLKPMGAYERKIVHDVIADAGLASESEGEGPRRHVVVSTGD